MESSVIVVNKQYGQITSGGSPGYRLGYLLTAPVHKIYTGY
jgi:hypothetical protein